MIPFDNTEALRAWLKTATRDEVREIIFSDNLRLQSVVSRWAPAEFLQDEELRVLLPHNSFAVSQNAGLSAEQAEQVARWGTRALARDAGWNPENPGFVALRALQEAGHSIPDNVLAGLRTSLSTGDKRMKKVAASVLISLWDPIEERFIAPLYAAISGDEQMLAQLFLHPAVPLSMIRLHISKSSGKKENSALFARLLARADARKDPEIRKLWMEHGGAYLWDRLLGDQVPGEFALLLKKAAGFQIRELLMLLKRASSSQWAEIDEPTWVELLSHPSSEVRLQAQGHRARLQSETPKTQKRSK